MIETEFEACYGTYGYRRITARLGCRGVSVHRDTVRGLMRQAGLVAAQPCRKVRTTIPTADLEARPDLMRRDSRCPGTGSQVGGGTPSCIRTWAGFVYLATEVFSPGWVVVVG